VIEELVIKSWRSYPTEYVTPRMKN